jgi:hypothetical protein
VNVMHFSYQELSPRLQGTTLVSLAVMVTSPEYYLQFTVNLSDDESFYVVKGFIQCRTNALFLTWM